VMYIPLLSCLDLGRVGVLSPVVLLPPGCFCLTSVPGLGEGDCSFDYSFKLGGNMGVNFCFLRDDVRDGAERRLRCSSCEFLGCSSASMAAERRFPMVAVKLLLRQISGLQSFSEASGGFNDVSARSVLPLPFALGWRILSSLVLGLDSGLSVRVLMSVEIFPSPFPTGDNQCVFNISDAPWMVAPGAGSCDTSNAWSLLEVRSEAVVLAGVAFFVGV
jgi:hypothetical protein